MKLLVANILALSLFLAAHCHSCGENMLFVDTVTFESVCLRRVPTNKFTRTGRGCICDDGYTRFRDRCISLKRCKQIEKLLRHPNKMKAIIRS